MRIAEINRQRCLEVKLGDENMINLYSKSVRVANNRVICGRLIWFNDIGKKDYYLLTKKCWFFRFYC